MGIMSYNGSINFGLIGDYEAMPMLDSFAQDLEDVLAELAATVPAEKQADPKSNGSARKHESAVAEG